MLVGYDDLLQGFSEPLQHCTRHLRTQYLPYMEGSKLRNLHIRKLLSSEVYYSVARIM